MPPPVSVFGNYALPLGQIILSADQQYYIVVSLETLDVLQQSLDGTSTTILFTLNASLPPFDTSQMLYGITYNPSKTKFLLTMFDNVVVEVDLDGSNPVVKMDSTTVIVGTSDLALSSPSSITLTADNQYYLITMSQGSYIIKVPVNDMSNPTIFATHAAFGNQVGQLAYKSDGNFIFPLNTGIIIGDPNNPDAYRWQIYTMNSNGTNIMLWYNFTTAEIGAGSYWAPNGMIPIKDGSGYLITSINDVGVRKLTVNFAPLPAAAPTAPASSVPAAPTSLAAVAAGDLGVSVSFTPGSNGGSSIINYEYSINNGSSYTAYNPAVISSPIVISGLTSGQSYNIKIRAVNSVGTGPASSSVAYTVAAQAPTSRVYTNTGAQFNKAGIVVSYTDDTGAVSTQNVTFANKTFSVDSGLNVSAGDAYLAGTAQIHGAAQLDSSLDVMGSGRFRNALVVDGAFNMGSSLNVAGAATMGSTLAVTGATNLNNTLDVSGAASLNSSLAVTGASNLNNTLAVAGAASMNSSLAVTGASNLNNTLAVAGAASLNSSLAVVGATTLTGALDVKAASHLENTLLVDGAASLGAALTVTGATTLNNGMTVNGTSTHNGALVVSGASSVGGAIGVTGAATLNSSMNVKGASRLENVLVVDGAASLNNSLAVAGAASVVGAMDITGASRLRNSAQIDGAATLGNSLAVAGAASMASTLDVTGASRLRNNVVVDGTASMGSSLAVTGAATLSSSLAVTGASNLNSSLAVAGAANLNNTLAVTGAATLSSSLAVTGAANLNSSLAVTGAANLNNTLAVSGAASLSSSLAVTGAASMSNTLAVTGAATFQNNVTVNGNLTVLGSQTAIDTTSLQVKDNAILLADGNTADVLQSGIQLQYKPSGSAAVKYAGVKRQPTTGEFVFFKDSVAQFDDPAVVSPAADVYATVMADSFNSASDARLKKNVVTLEGALDKIDAIRGVHYHWIDAAQSESRQVGVIAQEIQAVYPELVMEGGNGFLSVDYPKLTAVLIESIKELKAMAIALMNK